jgi:transposase
VLVEALQVGASGPVRGPGPLRGLKHDHDAVLNGLTLPWSSGIVEGNVNRI